MPGPRRLSRDVSGLALQAVITDTLLQERRLRDLPPAPAWVATGSALFGASACLLLVRRLRSAWIGAAAIGATTLVASVAAFRSGVVTPLAVPLVLLTMLAAVAAYGRGRLSAPPE